MTSLAGPASASVRMSNFPQELKMIDRTQIIRDWSTVVKAQTVARSGNAASLFMVKLDKAN